MVLLDNFYLVQSKYQYFVYSFGGHVMPDPRENKVSCSSYRCEIEVTLEVLSGKWKALIIWYLNSHEVIRYNEFRKLIPEITQKMLTQQLKELEKYNIVSRKVYPSVPPMVEYSLTDFGKELIPILQAMDKWGKEFVKNYKSDESHDLH